MQWINDKIAGLKDFVKETREMKREDWKELGGELWATFKPDIFPLIVLFLAAFLPGHIAAFVFGVALFWLIGNMVEHRARVSARREVILILKELIRVEKTAKPEEEKAA